MTGLEFLSATIGQLIWPVLVLVVVLILRDPIKRLAASPRLKRVKAGPSGVEFEFREELGEVEKELGEIQKEQESVASEVTEYESTDKSGLNSFRAEMARLASVSPRAAVLESHTRLEKLLRESVERNSEASQVRARSMRQLTDIACRQGWLPQKEASLLWELSHLRNRVAHEPDEAITNETALWYVDLTAEVATVIHHASGRSTAQGPFL